MGTGVILSATIHILLLGGIRSLDALSDKKYYGKISGRLETIQSIEKPD